MAAVPVVSDNAECNLKEALGVVLKANGTLDDLKARLRAEAFFAKDDKTRPRPPLCRENLLLNELIREYLDYNKYAYTSSVLVAESGQPEEAIHRSLMCREIGFPADDGDTSSSKDGRRRSSVPLLYSVLAALLSGKDEQHGEESRQRRQLDERRQMYDEAQTGSLAKEPLIFSKPQP